MAEISSEKAYLSNYIEGISYKEKNNFSEKERKYSINSSKSDSFFTNLNSEIKIFIENEADMSFSSNSNSESPEQRKNIDDLLDSKYWRVNKDLSLENEKDFFIKNKNLLLLNENEKKLSKLFEGSNKQSTQSNEDEETRIEPLHNISDSESNNSPLISLLNNESEENENICDKLPQEIICDKTSNKENKNKLQLNNNITKEKENKINKKNTMNEYINHNKIKLNDGEFTYPYGPIKDQNNNNNGFSSFYQDAFLNHPFCYNLPSPISNRSILSVNSNSGNKMNNNISKDNEEEYFEKENKMNISGQNDKFKDSSNCNKKLNQNKKDKTDLPLIANQDNYQNLQMKYNSSKLNLNMTYYPKIQNNNIICHKQSMDKINNSSNYLPELNNKNNISNNLSEKKIKYNTLNLNEQNYSINNNNTNNNLNNVIYHKMTINNYKNITTNKNMNNATNKSSLKGEKQILNLDDIVSGKDTRTTIMIRNIPIKYTDKILNEALIEFHGKYDCLYLPYDYEKNGNKGYAFINFVNPLHILYFYERFNGKKWAHFESSKICELNSAHFQGINEIQKHAKNFKDLKKSHYYSDNNKENDMIIPSKYLFKLKKRFPKMKFNENKNKKILFIKSFE
jgi:hypothetical protein